VFLFDIFFKKPKNKHGLTDNQPISERNKEIKQSIAEDQNKNIHNSSKILLFFKTGWQIFNKSISKFLSDQSWIISAGLTYKTIFSILPLSAIFLGILSINPDFLEYKEKVIDTLHKFVLPESVSGITILIDGLLGNISTISIVGIVVLIYVAIDLFSSIDDQINRIWGVSRKKSIMKKNLVYWTFITMVPVFIGISIYYINIIGPFIMGVSEKFSVHNILTNIYTYIIVEFIILGIYFVMPNERVNVYKALICSTIVAVVFILLRYVFTYYSSLFILNWKIYGSFAVLIFFLIWMNINWGLLIFGFEVLCVWQNRLYLNRYNFKKFFLYDVGFFLLILRIMNDDFKNKGTGYTAFELSGILGCSINDIKEILNSLENSKILYFDDNKIQRCHLKKDITTIELTEIEDLVWRRILIDIYRTPEIFQSICERLGDKYFERKDNVPVFIDQLISD